MTAPEDGPLWPDMVDMTVTTALFRDERISYAAVGLWTAIALAQVGGTPFPNVDGGGEEQAAFEELLNVGWAERDDEGNIALRRVRPE